MHTQKPFRSPFPSKRRSGFTLVELMVVIVIIGLLVALVSTDVLGNLFKGQVGTAKASIVTMTQALDSYAIENNGRYPDSLEELVTPDENGFRFLKADSVPLDPWGNEYIYEPPGSGQPDPRITCLGGDGEVGGEGVDRDFDNFMIRNQEI